jgi:S-disulfanyl-L-cysteine oxidoreductase SoxD
MKASTGLFWLGVVFVAGCSSTPGAAQTNSPGPVAEVAASKTIWDGVYTAAQAERGQRVSQASCFGCHAQTEWANPMFLTVWSGRPVGVLYENLRMTMPYDAPGRLSREEYADVVSYMLRLNNVPAGETELPSDAESLATILMAPAANE